MEKQSTWPSGLPGRVPLVVSVALGAGFGLFFRLLQESQRLNHLSRGGGILMSVAFLALGPFAIGYITIHFAERSGLGGFVRRFFLPWLSVLVFIALTWLFNLEGLICIVFALPIALVFSSLGGIAAGLVARARRAGTTLACVALLPLLLAPIESGINSPVEYRTVDTSILIHADPSTVWSNIERVRPIAPAELHQTWAHAIGFPRPVEATLSYEGAGGVRHASFERGLMFIETVTRWEPERVLAFSIRADTEHIPRTTLDEHVTIGGRYFDVLDGEYHIEPLPGGGVLLKLSSRERLSTDINGYAGLWSDLVMRTLQKSILKVVKHRCEAGSVAYSGGNSEAAPEVGVQ